MRDAETPGSIVLPTLDAPFNLSNNTYKSKTLSYRRKTMKSAFLLSALLCSTLPALANISSICDNTPGNIVQNCGFEAGTYQDGANVAVPLDWVASGGWDTEPGYNDVRNSPYSGNYNLSIGNYQYQTAPVLGQTLHDTNGFTYSGSLWVDYAGSYGYPGAFFDVLINNQNVVALSSTSNPSTGTYYQFNFSFTGTGSDTLKLTGNTDPGEWYVDDIVVTRSATPEPGLTFVLGIGIAGLLYSRYLLGRKRRLRPSVTAREVAQA